ncbi:hypothetical protein AAC387_Pa07g2158 [Persea americana]
MNRILVKVMHSMHTTLLYSLEALQEVVQWERVLTLQSRDGSFLSSPSFTAIAYMKTGDEKCLSYLTNTVRRFKDHAPCQYPIDLLECLWAVDTIHRLGIDHHFRNEISNVLDYVYRFDIYSRGTYIYSAVHGLNPSFCKAGCAPYNDLQICDNDDFLEGVNMDDVSLTFEKSEELLSPMLNVIQDNFK